MHYKLVHKLSIPSSLGESFTKLLMLVKLYGSSDLGLLDFDGFENMHETKNKAANIIAKGARRRFLGGIAAIILGILLGVVLIWQDAEPPWRLVLFIPFTYGSFGLLQAKEKT